MVATSLVTILNDAIYNYVKDRKFHLLTTNRFSKVGNKLGGGGGGAERQSLNKFRPFSEERHIV